MIKKYSVADLVGVLGVSRTAVNRKIEKHGFETVQEYVNGRPLKLVCLSNEQIEALKKEVEVFKSDNTDTRHSDETFVNNSSPVQHSQNLMNTGNLLDSLMKHNETVLSEIRYYADRLVDTERNKVKLLEDSENRKDREIIELRALNITLQERIKLLDTENNQLKQKSTWWKFKK